MSTPEEAIKNSGMSIGVDKYVPDPKHLGAAEAYNKHVRFFEANADELGRRAALFLSIEGVHHCECHSWWGPALMQFSRNYEGIAREIVRQQAEHKHTRY